MIKTPLIRGVSLFNMSTIKKCNADIVILLTFIAEYVIYRHLKYFVNKQAEREPPIIKLSLMHPIMFKPV